MKSKNEVLSSAASSNTKRALNDSLEEPSSKRMQRISKDTDEESENEIISNDRNHNEDKPYFATVEKDMKNPLVLKRLQAIPCGNFTAEKCFKWFIHPISSTEFFDETFEKKTLFVKRDNPCYYKDLFSGKDFDRIMRENLLEYTKNIDVVTYADGERVTLNPEGRAYAPTVWDFYQQGCSIRMRNPQAYSKKLWQMCSLLQEYFGSFVGVNMYLTPPGSQGFAPHFDDIEAFVLQLEGSKHWRVYSPRSQKETLPSYSSGNFTQDEIGIPIREIEMKPGDLLYFPRGFIHQAKTPEETHSLHITVSTYQKNTWGHLLELALPSALSKAIENELELRESLPKDYLNYVGEVNIDNDCPERHRFIEKATSLAQRVIKYLPIDEASDQHSKDFIHGSMPPYFTEREKECSIHGGGEYWEDGQVKAIVELQPDSKIRFIRKRIIRMIIEENSARVYHAIENSRDYKEFDLKYVECDLSAVPAFQFLLRAHPKFIPIEELPLQTLEDKMNFANDLYSNGFLMTDEPLDIIDD